MNMNMKEMAATIAALQQQIKDLESQKAGSKLTLKVSSKGAMSVYGMGRFPVTLYKEQWERLMNHSDAIKTFLAANADKLAAKA